MHDDAPPEHAPPALRDATLRDILRSVSAFRGDPLGTMVRARERYGDYCRFRFGTIAAYMIADPAMIEDVLVTRQKTFTKRTPAYDVLRQMFGDGLITSEGSFWLRQRRIAQPTFHRASVAGFAEQMAGCAQRMLDGWEDAAARGASFDVARDLSRATLEVVGRALLSTDLDRDAQGVAGALEALQSQALHRTTSVWRVPMAVPTPANRRFLTAKAIVDDTVRRIIAQRRARAPTFAALDGRVDLLAMLMGAVDEDTGESMTDAQLRDEVATILLAGHETTAGTLSWALASLAAHPEVARAAHAEVDLVLAGRVPTLADLPRLVVVDRIRKETLRLYPSIWMLGRRAERDEPLGGHVVRRGSFVFLSPWVVHRHPRWWPSPDAFDPDRFTGEPADRPKLAYLPFSAGPRKCIGDAFAVIQMQIFLAMCLQRFELTLCAGQHLVPDAAITLRPPRGGLLVNVRAR